jgi:hypothetical protein
MKRSILILGLLAVSQSSLLVAQDTKGVIALAEQTLALVQKSTPLPAQQQKLQTLIDAYRATPSPEKLNEIRQVRREIILCHPALKFDDLLFNLQVFRLVKGYPNLGQTFDGHMVDSYLGANHTAPVPGVVVLKDWKKNPKLDYLTRDRMPAGATFHPDLSFDGKRVAFSFFPETGKVTDKNYLIWEIGIDGNGLRQVTGTTRDPMTRRFGRKTQFIEDFDPCYLPDGGFAFTSTRVMTTCRCVNDARYNPAFVLHRCDADGGNLRALSYGELNEYDPTVMPDGRLVYTRWEYVQRNLQMLHGLWSINTDGTGTQHVYGNNTIDPNLINQARPIPESKKLIATANAHHGMANGTLILVDTEKGEDGLKPLTMVTPEIPFPEQQSGSFFTKNVEWKPDANGVYPFGIPYNLKDQPEKATMPADRRLRTAIMAYPLTEQLFFVSGKEKSDEPFSIWLVDTLGGRELIFKDEKFDACSPLPVQPRPIPATRVQAIVPGKKVGIFSVHDVYQNRFDLQGVIKRGTVKAIRILEILDQASQKYNPNSKYIFELPRRVLGTVPVDEKGSATFYAPCEKTLQFQLLDAKGMAVMTMRTEVYLQPGEKASCIGCHEPKGNSSSPVEGSSANRQVHSITPPAWNTYQDGFSFSRSVQPILDRHCIGCHGLNAETKKFSLLSVPSNHVYTVVSKGDPNVVLTWPNAKKVRASEAYHNLLAIPKLVSLIPYMGENVTSKPYDFYAYAGRLIQMLDKGHKGVTLTPLEREQLVTWLDLNAPFAGDYSFNRAEDRQMIASQIQALRTALPAVIKRDWGKQPIEALINSADPEQSRALLAPLAIEAGGWGQSPVIFKDRKDPAFIAWRQQILACIEPLPFQDVNGTCGRGSLKGCQCGACWVREQIDLKEGVRK